MANVLNPAATSLGAMLELALAGDPSKVRRLGHARTSVTFCAGRERTALLLDRQPPQVSAASEPTEIEISLDAEQAQRFAAGQLVLPLEAAGGFVQARGPLRKYLRVDPVLRRLLAEVHRDR